MNKAYDIGTDHCPKCGKKCNNYSLSKKIAVSVFRCKDCNHYWQATFLEATF